MLDVSRGLRARHEDAVRTEVEALLDADAVVATSDADEGLGTTSVDSLQHAPDLLGVDGGVLLVDEDKVVAGGCVRSAERGVRG